ncbi:MAG: iron ABC transporter permease [Methanosarcinaceae archaeon]|nr:iron ABC transporter permease [Methanosarcinaceae archaeon]
MDLTKNAEMELAGKSESKLTGKLAEKYEEDAVSSAYNIYIGKKYNFLGISIIILIFLFLYSIAVGFADVSTIDVVRVLLYGIVARLVNFADVSTIDVSRLFLEANLESAYTIIWHIRLPRALAAIASGVGLSVAGVALQSILRNPLGSPYTLGISHAAAFGAAFSVIVLGTGTMRSTGADAIMINNPYVTTTVAFAFSMLATFILLAIAKYKGSSPEVMILSGVALSSLFTAGTMFLQYFADDTQLAAVVFWTFGDVGRAHWGDFFIILVVTVFATGYFYLNRWNYNAIDAGDETAKGLGVEVEKIRLYGMLIASLVTAFIVSFLGVIGFVGLVCPHISRRFVGDDQRFLLPASCLVGGMLLLGSDTAARMIMAPHELPVAILTAFMGAPVFLYLLVRGYKH